MIAAAYEWDRHPLRHMHRRHQCTRVFWEVMVILAKGGFLGMKSLEFVLRDLLSML